MPKLLLRTPDGEEHKVPEPDDAFHIPRKGETVVYENKGYVVSRVVTEYSPLRRIRSVSIVLKPVPKR